MTPDKTDRVPRTLQAAAGGESQGLTPEKADRDAKQLRATPKIAGEAPTVRAARQIRESTRAMGYEIHLRPHPVLPNEVSCGKAISALGPHEFSVQYELVTCERCLGLAKTKEKR